MYLSTCVFCSATAEEAWVITDDAVAVPHSDPLANCHMVVAPRRHVLTFYDLDVQEQKEHQKVWKDRGRLMVRQRNLLRDLDTEISAIVEGGANLHVQSA